MMKLSGETMTLSADHVPLRFILRQLGRSGVAVKIDPDINPVVTADFKDKHIQEVLDQILAGNSHALVWKQNDSGNPEPSQIIIYKKGHLNEAEELEPSASLIIKKNTDTGSLYVNNKILIQFRTGVKQELIQATLKDLKAGIKLFHKELGIYEITLPEGSNMEEALASLSQIPGVGTVEPDYAYRAPEPVQYEMEFKDTRGETIIAAVGSSLVAILDTGLDTTFLEQNLNFASFDALEPESVISDTLGHGTQMALIASGQTAPVGQENSSFLNPVISIRAFDNNGYTSNTILLKGIDFAVEQGARVLSLSWGSETDSAFLKQAMRYAASKGLKVVAAAGNLPTGNPVYPAAYENVTAVAALAPDGKAWEKSNYGDFVDISAPGFANLPVGFKGEPGTYAGTSIATAYIAGKLAAYLRDNPDEEMTPEKLLKY